MIGDADRGSAWTNAFLGLRAKEIHLCGDARALDLIKSITELTNDNLYVKEYKRINKLEVAKKPIKLETGMKDGDCVITFSVKKGKELRTDLNDWYPDSARYNNCSIIYGQLPPSIKKEEAQKFNSSDTKFLIATNAIGMGLNLNIDRIIFSSLKRHTGKKLETIDEYEIKQIAGRAGRLRKSGGEVTATDAGDLKIIERALKDVNNNVLGDDEIGLSHQFSASLEEFKTYDQHFEKETGAEENQEDQEDMEGESNRKSKKERKRKKIDKKLQKFYKPLKFKARETGLINKAALFPNYEQISNFHEMLHSNSEETTYKFSHVIKEFAESARLEDIYFMKNYSQFCKVRRHKLNPSQVADLIEDIELDLFDRYTLASCPLALKGNFKLTKECFIQFAHKISEGEEAGFPGVVSERFREISEEEGLDLYTAVAVEEIHHSKSILVYTCFSHLFLFKVCDIYKWLCSKFGYLFYDVDEAEFIKQEVIDLLSSELRAVQKSSGHGGRNVLNFE